MHANFTTLMLPAPEGFGDKKAAPNSVRRRPLPSPSFRAKAGGTFHLIHLPVRLLGRHAARREDLEFGYLGYLKHVTHVVLGLDIERVAVFLVVLGCPLRDVPLARAGEIVAEFLPTDPHFLLLPDEFRDFAFEQCPN